MSWFTRLRSWWRDHRKTCIARRRLYRDWDKPTTWAALIEMGMRGKR